MLQILDLLHTVGICLLKSELRRFNLRVLGNRPRIFLVFKLIIDLVHLFIHFCIESFICDLFEVVWTVSNLKKLFWYSTKFPLNNFLFFKLNFSRLQYWDVFSTYHGHEHIVHHFRQNIPLFREIPFLQIIDHFELDPIRALTSISWPQFMQQNFSIHYMLVQRFEIGAWFHMKAVILTDFRSCPNLWFEVLKVLLRLWLEESVSAVLRLCGVSEMLS